eukprot:m.100255 g.100255  ORF g.100255 m.100255 type:complete len:238 (-) comp10339_c0_seq2:176-889(-)
MALSRMLTSGGVFCIVCCYGTMVVCLQRVYTQVYKREGVSPFAAIRTAIGQMFIFVPMFFACRGLGYAEVPSMLDGGVAWFPNLCAADPLYILPTVSAISMLLMIEGGVADGMAMSPQMLWFFRAMSGVTFFVTMDFPAIVLLYFATSNTFSLLQSLVLRMSLTRRLCGIPDKIDHGIKPPQSPGLASTWSTLKKRYEEQEQSLNKAQKIDSADIRAQALENLNKSKQRRRTRNTRD